MPSFNNGIIDQQLLVEGLNCHSSSLGGSLGASANDQEALGLQHVEPNVEQWVQSLLQSLLQSDSEDEGMQQASSTVPDMSGSMQPSAMFQNGMHSWHTAAALRSTAISTELGVASSTQESANTTPFPGELAQAVVINQYPDAGSTID